MPGSHGEGCGCREASTFDAGGEFLLGFIDKDGLRCLNEEVEGSIKGIFKSYENRLDESKVCRSTEGDPELIVHIPFVSPCKISSLHLIGGESGSTPSSVRIYQNRDDIDFSVVDEIEAVQEVALQEDFHGAIEYPLKVAKLQNVTSLTLYFPTNRGADATEIFYIGLRGQGSNLQRKAVVTVYEARPNLSDHEVRDDSITPQFGL